MALVNSLLSSCEADEYIGAFTQHGIDLQSFKILNESDLIQLGIKDKECRKKLLECIENLHINIKKIPELKVDSVYTKLVLDQMYIHLIKHLAILSIAFKQPDVVICNFNLSPATQCLANSLADLEKNLSTFEQKFHLIPKSQKRRKDTIYVISAAAVFILAVGFFQCRSLIK